jgi:uncharacterized protein YceK
MNYHNFAKLSLVLVTVTLMCGCCSLKVKSHGEQQETTNRTEQTTRKADKSTSQKD